VLLVGWQLGVWLGVTDILCAVVRIFSDAGLAVKRNHMRCIQTVTSATVDALNYIAGGKLLVPAQVAPRKRKRAGKK
jgi:hypothetical protein